MRPKAALRYIKDINSVMDAVETKIEEAKTSAGLVPDVLALTKQFALESIAVMFLGKRFNILQGLDSQTKINTYVNFRF